MEEDFLNFEDQDENNEESNDSTVSDDEDAEHFEHMVIKSSHMKNDKISTGGYMYRLNRRINTKIYWLCDIQHSTNCNARLITIQNHEGNYIILKESQHSHGPSAHRSTVAKVKSELRQNAINDTNSAPSRLVDNLHASDTVRNNNLVTFLGTESSQREIVRRARKSHSKIVYPPQPTKLDFVFDLDFVDMKLDDEQLLLFDCLSQDKSKRVSIFTTDALFTHFCNSELIALDGTFKTCPEPYKQLFIIHGNIPGYDEYFTYPLIWILMSGKDQNMYVTAFNAIREHAISLSLPVKAKFSMNDFEKAIRNALAIVFPSIDNRACFFHLRQTTIKRLKKLKLYRKYQSNPMFAFEINLVMALAFFPPDDIEELFESLMQTGSDDAKKFYNWFKPLYIRKHDGSEAPNPPSFWSVHDLVLLGLPKTQNGAEQSHHSLFLACNKIQHLSLYKFITVLKAQMIKSGQNILKTLSGLNEKRRSKLHEEKERIIQDVLIDKDNPHKSLITSLHAVNTSLCSFIHLLPSPD